MAPSEVVEKLHSFYRLGHDNSITTAINGDYQAWKNYLIGVGFAPGVWVIAGLLVMLYLLCRCCCVKSARSHPDGYHDMENGTAPNSCARVSVGIMVTVVLVATAVAFKGGLQLKKGLDNLDGGLNGLQEQVMTLDSTVKLLQQSGHLALKNSSLCPAYKSEIDLHIWPFLNETNDAAEVLNQAADYVKLAEPVERQVFHWLLTAFGLPMAVLAVTSLIMLPGAMCTRSCRFLLRIGLFFSALVFIVLLLMVTVQMIWSIAAADYCINPDNNTIAIFHKVINQFPEDRGANPVFESYVNCDLHMDNPVIDQLNEAKTHLVQLEGVILILKPSATCPKTALTGLSATVNAANHQITNIMSTLKCENLNKYYVMATHDAICTDIEIGTVWLWVNQMFSFALLACLVSLTLKLLNERTGPGSQPLINAEARY